MNADKASGEYGKAVRRNRTKSQRATAQEIGISLATLGRIERGGTMSVDTFLKLDRWFYPGGAPPERQGDERKDEQCDPT